jgi:hypothetical protein
MIKKQSNQFEFTENKMANLPSYDATTPLSPEELAALPSYEDTSAETGKIESAIRGAAQGASMGFADEITGALESATSDKSYQQARDESRTAYKAAEESNPKTYLGGEFGGAAATALIPGLGAVTIPKMAVQGALYGLGTSEGDLTTKDDAGLYQAMKDTAIGGAVGGAAGALGKGVSKLFSKGSKIALSNLGPSVEAIESKLAMPEAKGLLASPTAEAGVLEGIVGDLKNKIMQGSMKAQSHLNPEVATNFGEIGPIIQDLKASLLTQGGLVGEEQKAATAVLDKWGEDLFNLANKNNGNITEPVLGDFIRAIDKNVPKWDAPHSDIIDSVQKQLRGSLDQALKSSNPEYAKAMQPVSETIGLMNDVKKAFNLSPMMEATDATNVKLGTVLKETKSNAQGLLKRLEEMYGHPFLDNLKNHQLSQEFEKGVPIHGLGLLGRTSRLVGVDGGTVAKSIIDKYLQAKGAVENTASSQALSKYGPLLVDAAKRGGNALASTHFVLATSEPEYQTLVDEHQEQ